MIGFLALTVLGLTGVGWAIMTLREPRPDVARDEADRLDSREAAFLVDAAVVIRHVGDVEELHESERAAAQLGELEGGVVMIRPMLCDAAASGVVLRRDSGSRHGMRSIVAAYAEAASATADRTATDIAGWADDRASYDVEVVGFTRIVEARSVRVWMCPGEAWEFQDDIELSWSGLERDTTDLLSAVPGSDLGSATRTCMSAWHDRVQNNLDEVAGWLEQARPDGQATHSAH